jgi:hypothetical protein
MSRLDYTIKITYVLSEEWLQEKNSAAGISGTGNEGTEFKHLQKLPSKKWEDFVCVQACMRMCVNRCSSSKRTKHGPFKRQRNGTMYVKYEKSLQGQCILHHKFTKWHQLQILMLYLQKRVWNTKYFVKVHKHLQKCSVFTAATKNLQQKYAEKQLSAQNLNKNCVSASFNLKKVCYKNEQNNWCCRSI